MKKPSIDFSAITFCLGGTFDPIHHGHLRLVAELKIKFPGAKILLIPAADPVHKTGVFCSKEHRLVMSQLAVKEMTGIEVSDIEMQRKDKSYTVETLKLLRKTSPQNIFCWVLGQDAFNDLETWYQVDLLHQFCHLLVVSRPGYEPDNSGYQKSNCFGFQPSDDFEKILIELNGTIFHCQLPLLDISSTRIRQLLSQYQKGYDQVKWLLPDPILDYITKHQLYKSTE